MKTFLKILLIALGVIIAIKLLPVALAIVGVAVGIVLGAAVIGVGAISVALCVALGAVALLSPLWLPVLAVVGIVALVRRNRHPVPVAA